MSLFKLVRSFVDPSAASTASASSTPLSPLSPHSHNSHDHWNAAASQLSHSLPLERMTVTDSMHEDASQLRADAVTQPSSPRERAAYSAAANRSLKHRWESHAHNSRSQRRRLHSSTAVNEEKAQPLLVDDDDDDSDSSRDSMDEESKQSLPSSLSSSASSPLFPSSVCFPSAPVSSVVSQPSVAVRVSMSVSADYSAMLAMGYTVRQARYATRLFNGDTEQAMMYLLDMESYKDALEIQIVQAELEAADEKDREEAGSGKRQHTPTGSSTSTWMRIFPKFSALSNTLVSLSPKSVSLRRTQSQPLPGDHMAAGSQGSSSMSSSSPSPIPVDDPAAPLSRVANHPPILSSPAPPSSPFACDTCTYVNEALGTVHCEMCGTGRPESEQQRNWSASLRQCGICFDSFPLSSMSTSAAPCAHLFCWSCFESYLLAQLDDNKTAGAAVS